MQDWEKWTPAQQFQNLARFGRLEVDTASFFESGFFITSDRGFIEIKYR